MLAIELGSMFHGSSISPTANGQFRPPSSGVPRCPLFGGFKHHLSLDEVMDFKLFGKTILVVNKKFRLFLANQLGK